MHQAGAAADDDVDGGTGDEIDRLVQVCRTGCGPARAAIVRPAASFGEPSDQTV